MSLRRRLVLLAAGTVGVTVVLASVVCYFAMRAELRDQVDAELMRQGERVAFREEDRFGGGRGGRGGRAPFSGPFGGPPPPPERPGEREGPAQVIRSDGEVAGDASLPVTEEDLELARAGGGDPVLSDREVDGEHVRVLTQPLRIGAVQVLRSLESVDSTLSRLRLVLVVLCLVGTAFALAVSRLFARQVVAPVTELTETAEHISATDDLGRRIESAGGEDEVGRMASRFNAMLDRLQSSRHALAASVSAQRQLVADASHELRTPVTSLRTNVEVLLSKESASLGAEERRRLLEDMRAQSEELTLLINDVIELARGDQPLAAAEDVRLDEVVGEAIGRAQRNTPGVRFDATLDPVVVRGDAERLGRAVGNLLDNAAKHSSEVSVRVADGVVEVRDHGPGVPDDDKALIFDRFYRGATARGRPGSGLGLAIVRQVAEAHGGDVTVEDAAGGGALFRLTIP
jgi:two-component system sensor histidine kinase MprB